MKKLRFTASILAGFLALGLLFVSCDNLFGKKDETEKFDTSTINGDWYLMEGGVGSNKTGSIMKISGNSGILTVIGNNDIFSNNIDINDYGYNLGGIILRNISYIGIMGSPHGKNYQYWDCESIISTAINGRPWSDGFAKQYISYNTDTKILAVYIAGDDLMGFYYGFTKQ